MNLRQAYLENDLKQRPAVRGFALVVTLSLMILLTVIAMGLLSLSAVSLRSTSQAPHLFAGKINPLARG